VVILETERLRLRRLTLEDAEFVLELVNDPDWLRYIGDRGVRTLEDAREYLLRGPIATYALGAGLGLHAVELREDGVPIGICGLLERDWLEDVDLGFAMLPGFRARGYAFEAAAATLEYGRARLGLTRIVAIVSPENEASMRLLTRLGMRVERRLERESGEICLFAPAPAAAREGGEGPRSRG
jgi:RimJ/RimL family protein N-acetyltransferase